VEALLARKPSLGASVSHPPTLLASVARLALVNLPIVQDERSLAATSGNVLADLMLAVHVYLTLGHRDSVVRLARVSSLAVQGKESLEAIWGNALADLTSGVDVFLMLRHLDSASLLYLAAIITVKE